MRTKEMRRAPAQEKEEREGLYRKLADLYVNIVPIIRRTPRSIETIRMLIKAVQLFNKNRLGAVLSVDEAQKEANLKKRMQKILQNALVKSILEDQNSFQNFVRRQFSTSIRNRIAEYGFYNFEQFVRNSKANLQPVTGYKRFANNEIEEISTVLDMYGLWLGMSSTEFGLWLGSL